MAIIEKEIILVGSKGKKTVIALFDNSTSYSHISPQLAESLAPVDRLPEPLEIETAEKQRHVTASEIVRLEFWIDGYHFSDEFMVIPHLSEDVIIGTATMQKWRFKLDFEKKEVIIDPRVTRLRLL